ncbi:hypothetical protein [Hydrogenophaga sp.]|uniref:hypothetical protein n=1 Tax=Hydrogenophaga sp. TaxID=1904254 RepID=UPI00261F8445|nr:hypothetical protein [Hydrogenophaga sp.]
MGNTVASLYANTMATIGLEIFNFEISATDSPNRMGFFGSLGAPNSAVIVGQYQDRTHVTDHVGTDLGQMINAKFTGASTVEHSGVPFTGGFSEIPRESGTLLARFTEENNTAVITQSATFRAVNFDAGSGVPDISDLATGITVQAAQLQDTSGNAADAAWSEISSGGAALGLADQSIEAAVHDFHLLVSGNPSAAGRKIDFGYFLQLEFL